MTLSKVKDFQQGTRVLVEGEFGKKVLFTKKKDAYFMATIKDNSGMCSQQVWNNLPIYPVVEGIESGQWVRAEVVCTSVGEYTNMEIHSIEVIERVLPTVVDEGALKNELRDEIKSMEDEGLKGLINNVFRREDVKMYFWTAPATQKSAYSHDAGLASHVVRSIRLCKAIAEVFNKWNLYKESEHVNLNVDLLKAGCILHDIGKVRVFMKKGYSYEKTEEGMLFEDSYLSMKIVLEELQKADLPDYQRMMLEHVLAGAKGQLNFGALHIPRSAEAVAFSLIDTLDSQMANFEHLGREADPTDLFALLMDKRYFLGSYDA